MGTTVYVDVLLVVNYIVNLLLILCTTKLSGILPKRRKIVAAALFGSLCSLTIFLPFLGFFSEVFLKVAVSAGIVRIAMPWKNISAYLRHWFFFFAVNFFFAGAVLAIWMLFSPHWLTYFNGVVYFDISVASLLFATVGAYFLLALAGKLSRNGRIQGHVWRTQIYLQGKMCEVKGLVDTGNTLFEPFSGAPVIVCQEAEILPLLPEKTADAVKNKMTFGAEDLELELPLRLIPYQAVGKGGMLPAFLPDQVILRSDKETRSVDMVYIALSKQKIGGNSYNAILNPELITTKTTIGGATK